MPFTVGGQFDPNSAPEKLAVAIHELEHTNTEFEVSTVYLNVLNAFGAVRSAAFTGGRGGAHAMEYLRPPRDP